MILSDKYKLLKIITKSTYSTLYEAEHIIKKNKVAIKIESNELSKKLLEHEIQMYLYLKKSKDKINIPEIKYIGINVNKRNVKFNNRAEKIKLKLLFSKYLYIIKKAGLG